MKEYDGSPAGIRRAANDDDGKPSTSSQIKTSSSMNGHPVDKGWAWAIVVGVFGIHFFTFGYIRSFGILFLEFQNKFNASSAETAVITGIQFCVYSLANLFAVNVILKYFSIRQSCLTGCLLQSLGIALNGIVPDIKYLILTQGILFGSGQAFLYCPALIIVSQYFNEKRAIATAIATCGVSVGGVALPLLIRYLVDNYGLRGGLLLLSGTMLNQAVFSSLFTPTSKFSIGVLKERTHDDICECSDSVDILHQPNSSRGSPGLEPIEEHNKVLNKENEIGDIPSQYDIPSKQENESTLLLEHHLNSKHGAHQQYPLSEPTVLFSERHKKSNSENVDKACDRSSPSLQEMKSKSEKLNDTEMHLLTEKIMGDDNKSCDPSRKSSLKITVLNALAASSMDLPGSLNSLAHIEPPILSDHSTDKRNGLVVDGVQHDLKKKRRRWHVPAVVKTVAFWVILVFYGCGATASAAPAIFMPPLAKEKNLASMSTTMLMVSAVTEFFGRLLPGFIIHAGIMRASTVVMPPMVACATIYQFTALYNDYGALLTMAILSGLFTGTFWSTQSLVVIEVFGFDRLGPMLGFYLLILGLSLGASQPIAGLLKDVSGTYVSTFHFFGACYYMAALMMFVIILIRRSKNKNLSNTASSGSPTEKQQGPYHIEPTGKSDISRTVATNTPDSTI